MLTFALQVVAEPRQSDFTPPVITALILSGLSLIAGLVALAWQVAAFRLSGGRVKVRLLIGELVPYAGTSVVRTADHGRRELAPTDHPELSLVGLGMEVGFVLIENPGRLPITVTGEGFALRYGQKGTFRVGPRSFPITDHGGWDTADGSYLRLEPFSRAVFCFDFWSVIQERRGRGVSAPIELRAYAEVAGRRKPRLSSRRAKWVIPAGEVTTRDNPTRIRVADLILRVIVRSQWTTDTLARPDHYMAERMALLLTPISTVEQIHQALLTTGRTFWQNDDVDSEYVALQIQNEIDTLRDHIDWPSRTAKDEAQ